MDAATGRRIRNPVYRKESEISAQVAKRDLKALVEAGLLTPKGEKRGRVYMATDFLLGLRKQCTIERPIDDPFADAVESLEPDTQSDFVDELKS